MHKTGAINLLDLASIAREGVVKVSVYYSIYGIQLVFQQQASAQQT